MHSWPSYRRPSARHDLSGHHSPPGPSHPDQMRHKSAVVLRDTGPSRSPRIRVGPFWDGVEGRVPVPPAAATLGFGFVDATVDEITVSFEATPAFTNPMGEVLGAFQAAMLYDTVGPALLATLGPGEFIETLHLDVRFLNPTKPGRLIGVGRVVQ